MQTILSTEEARRVSARMIELGLAWRVPVRAKGGLDPKWTRRAWWEANRAKGLTVLGTERVNTVRPQLRKVNSRSREYHRLYMRLRRNGNIERRRRASKYPSLVGLAACSKAYRQKYYQLIKQRL